MHEQPIPTAQYEPLMSAYLKDGRKDETWHINWITWDGHTLRASARLEGGTGSATDQGRFHISIYALREIDAQLSIVSLHLKLGLSKKTAEVWLLKCVEECTAALTQANDVRFEMRPRLRLSKSGKVLSERVCQITDAGGGLVKLQALGLMPWDEATMGALPQDVFNAQH